MWGTVKLGNICELNLGKTPARNNKKYWDKEKITSNVWLSIADLNSSIENYIGDSKEYISDAGASLSKPVAKGTLLMSFKLTIGRLAFTSRDLWTNEAIVALPIKDENLIIKEFLYHALSSINWHKLTKDDVKIKGKTLNKKKLAVIEIPLPPLAEQKRIVAKLDKDFAEIDSAIATTEYKQKEVEKLKLSLLKNELSSDDHQSVAPICKVVKLCEVAKIIAGQSPKGKYYNKEAKGMPFYQGKKDYGERYLKSPTVWTTKITKRAFSGDILISVRAPIGALNYTTEEICIGRGLAAIRVGKHTSREYIFYFLLSFSKDLIGNSGVIFNSINKKQIEEIQFSLPPLVEQKRIVARLDETFKQADIIIANTQKQLSEYQWLKKSLLTRELQSEAA